MVVNIDFFLFFLSIRLLSFCSFNVVAVLIFWINVAVLFVEVERLVVVPSFILLVCWRRLDDVLVK